MYGESHTTKLKFHNNLRDFWRQKWAINEVSIDNRTQGLVEGTNANLLNRNCIFSLEY